MTQVDFNVIVAITSIGIWSKIIQTHFLLTQDLIITSSFIHSCSENAFLQCGHVCHVLIVIAILLVCLPDFEQDCHTFGMFAMFGACFSNCGYGRLVCQVIRLITAMWAFLAHFEADSHTVVLFAIF